MRLFFYFSIEDLIKTPAYVPALNSIKVAENALEMIEQIALKDGHESVDNVFNYIGCSPQMMGRNDWKFTSSWREGYKESLEEALKHVDAVVIVPFLGQASKMDSEAKNLCSKNLVSVMSFAQLFASEAESLKTYIARVITGINSMHIRTNPILTRGGRHK